MRPPLAEILFTFFSSYSGGFADSTGFLMAGSFTGHITGNLVLLTTSAAAGHWLAMSRPLTAVVTFLLATEIGLLSARCRTHDLRWAVLVVQCSILCTLGVGVLRNSPGFAWIVVGALSFCLGLQNGFVASVDGVAVHSSYMTGTATRLLKALSTSHTFGVRIRDPLAVATVVLSATVILGFLTGALSAFFARTVVGSYSPMVLCLPLLIAAISSSQRWQAREVLKSTS
jgi:uncharacterized membrane protein YoaK (UPF0700 family)